MLSLEEFSKYGSVNDIRYFYIVLIIRLLNGRARSAKYHTPTQYERKVAHLATFR